MNAEKQFREIVEAYEVLSDPDKRKNYDQFGPGFNQNQAGGGGDGGSAHQDFNFNDFFKHFDEAFANHKRAHESAHNRAHEEAMKRHQKMFQSGFDFDGLFDDDMFGDFFGGIGGNFHGDDGSMQDGSFFQEFSSSKPL